MVENRGNIFKGPASKVNVTSFDSVGREIVIGQTAFDEAQVAELTPIVQLQFSYNINADEIITKENDAGTVTQADNMAVLQTGASATSRAEMESRVPVKYNPGQGGLFRGTAIFTTGVAGSTQFFGIGDIGDGYFFGYNGVDFGLLRRRGGRSEIRTLTISAASVNAENITIELDGDSDATVAVTNQGADNASTRTLTANEIATHDFSDLGTGWQVFAEGPVVIFISFDAIGHSGAYSITASSAAGIYAQLEAGAISTDEFVAQSSWNKDIMDGTGFSGITLDQTKGNVYQINYQWLGFGRIAYFIENPSTGNFILVHQIEYANANILPSVNNPTLPLFVAVVNAANNSNLTMKIGSLAGFIEGKKTDLGLSKGTSVSTVAVAAATIPLLSIRNKFDYQSQRNRVRVRLNLLTISNDSKDILINIVLNPALTGAAFSDISTNTSVIASDTAATACTGGTKLFSIALNKDESEPLPLKEFDIELSPGDILTFTGLSIAAGTTVTVGINWRELF